MRNFICVALSVAEELPTLFSAVSTLLFPSRSHSQGLIKLIRVYYI